MAATQSRKHTLGMAGEFFVTAELLRRGLLASITYGNAKKADVVALAPNGTSAVVLEVKSTTQDSWIVGGAVPAPSEHLWVFVYMPPSNDQPPRYFVLTSSELHDLLSPGDAVYRARYQERHNHEFTGTGVVTLKRTEAQPFEGKWEKILNRVAGA
jgi:hypothetical protein